MNYFLKVNKTILVYSAIALILIPIFGINFLLSFLGNILLLFFLIPILLLILVFIGFNFYNSKINTFSNFDSDLKDTSNRNELDKKPSESTIEVKAEEIK